MIRSLRTGVSGLKGNQIRMDVVGNNIANVNTVAFKRSRAAFNEVLGQQLLGVGRTAGGTGINPSFVGLGVSVGSIDKNWSQGALENTGVSTDLALSGDGFFIARAGDRQLLTRAGNFTFNREGELVTANGLNVQGWAFDDQGNLVTGAPKDIQIDLNAQSPAKYTQNATVGGNLSSEIEPGESTSVSNLVYDEKGEAHTVIIEFTKNAALNEWGYAVRYESGAKEFPFGNAIGTPPAIATGTLTFDSDGTLSASPAIGLAWGVNFVDGGGAANIDLSGLTQFSGSTTAAFRDQDGSASGTVIGYGINPDGVLELNYSNGIQEKVYQLAIGNVNNPNGLDQQGENFYTTSSASGDLQLGRAGRDVRTSVVAGTLEMSNVDLATEFTELIVAQRGYQAAARVITTSDELLQETVQLKR